MNIFDTLIQDHKSLRDLGKSLLNTADPAKREKMFKEMKEMINAHLKSEERYFYIALLADDKSQERARHDLAEHHDIDELMDKVEEWKPDSDDWMDTYQKLHEELIHHLDEEEKETFKIAKEVLSDRQIDDLAKRYDEMMTDLK